MITLKLNGLIFEGNIWDKVFKNGPSKVCGRQPLKNLNEFFKGCVPQVLLGSFLNVFTFNSFFPKL